MVTIPSIMALCSGTANESIPGDSYPKLDSRESKWEDKIHLVHLYTHVPRGVLANCRDAIIVRWCEPDGLTPSAVGSALPSAFKKLSNSLHWKPVVMHITVTQTRCYEGTQLIQEQHNWHAHWSCAMLILARIDTWAPTLRFDSQSTLDSQDQVSFGTSLFFCKIASGL